MHPVCGEWQAYIGGSTSQVPLSCRCNHHPEGPEWAARDRWGYASRTLTAHRAPSCSRHVHMSNVCFVPGGCPPVGRFTGPLALLRQQAGKGDIQIFASNDIGQDRWTSAARVPDQNAPITKSKARPLQASIQVLSNLGGYHRNEAFPGYLIKFSKGSFKQHLLAICRTPHHKISPDTITFHTVSAMIEPLGAYIQLRWRRWCKIWGVLDLKITHEVIGLSRGLLSCNNIV